MSAQDPRVRCRNCHGSGEARGRPCYRCEGTGWEPAAGDAVGAGGQGREDPATTDLHWIAMAEAELDRLRAREAALREALGPFVAAFKRARCEYVPDAEQGPDLEDYNRALAALAAAGAPGDQGRTKCLKCNGSGEVYWKTGCGDDACPTCGGSGSLPLEKGDKR